MGFLLVFGDNVEDAMGPVRLVILYLLCGVAAVADSAHGVSRSGRTRAVSPRDSCSCAYSASPTGLPDAADGAGGWRVSTGGPRPKGHRRQKDGMNSTRTV
jgi:hypothetical protein